MIGYLEGKLVELTPTSTFLDINGLGYEINISLNTYNQIQGKTTCKLFTHLQVREDAWTLYGFAEKTEKEAFIKLISISGVGANTARMMLSSLTYKELYQIILSGDSKPLEKIKGIGTKTAQRIILELKGKVDFDDDMERYNLDNVHNSSNNDALYALLGLGISKPHAEAALKKIPNRNELPLEVLIKEALKNM